VEFGFPYQQKSVVEFIRLLGWRFEYVAVGYFLSDHRCVEISEMGYFFVVIGMNPLTIYLANRIIGWNNATEFFFAGIGDLVPAMWAPFVHAVGYVTIGWLFLYFLYKKKIFLKI